MSDCPRYEENRKECPCTSNYCARWSRCCECIAYHRRMGDLPACLRR
jgi:hypothetical protein